VIYYSHGDKGGVGKSMTSAVFLDYLLSIGKTPMLIEGDAGQPDIALRYSDYVKTRAVNLNRAGDAEAAIMAFSDALENLGDGDIVVNLPAAAGDTLEQLSEVLIGVAAELGHETRVFYTMGHTSTASKNAVRSFESGLISNAGIDNTCIVYPAFLGKIDGFDWVRSGFREKYETKEIVMPAIAPAELAQTVLSSGGTFADLCDKQKSTLRLSERLLFQSRFYNPAMAVFNNAEKPKEVKIGK
jgi:ATPases involved in chromosome partitioning